MGTQFVPASAGLTAELMAGPDLLSQLADALEQLSASGQGQGQGQGQGKGQGPAAGQTSSEGGGGGGSRGGNLALNQGTQDGPLVLLPEPSSSDSRTPGRSAHDSAATRGGSRAEPWFARLPPQLRRAIRSRAGHRAPRGYEERLRRYFESID
jgi:hypothetical protein